MTELLINKKHWTVQFKWFRFISDIYVNKPIKNSKGKWQHIVSKHAIFMGYFKAILIFVIFNIYKTHHNATTGGKKV